MTGGILTVLGGVGLFLFGIQTLTEGLRAVATDRARAIVARFTRTPLAGVVTGALSTAAVQSSSATTVMTIGFVGAGLLSFPQAVGVVLGANVGSTVTGWVVVLVGFRLKLGLVAMPILLAGALLRLISRGRAGQAGTALAGFGLMFVGLDMMQAGLEGFEGRLTPDSLPPDSLAGRLALVGIGLGISLVVRASSAGVATALVLVGAGAISLPQAAALVIGMDIGTTFTGLLATVGGSRAMRRTGVAHLLYNLVTAVAAFAVVGVVPEALRLALGGDAQAALVAFHTAFNLAGVVMVLPFVGAFARLVERLVPDDGEALAAPLDAALLADPGAALDAAGATAQATAAAVFAALAAALRPGESLAGLAPAVARGQTAVAALEVYAGRLAVGDPGGAAARRHGALLHQIDHLRRLCHRAGQEQRILAVMGDSALARPGRLLGGVLAGAAAGEDPARAQARLDRLGRLIAAREARLRRGLPLRFGRAGVAPAAAFALTDGIRWLSRTTAHAARILHYRQVAGAPAGAVAAPFAGG
ncbi:MAG: Na/Pi symporter [Rhodobacteraceae bacterium]|jgi:phosphate:Na+ symporter|nr:Na/Pi symporter [Paracoccaceae bacterium]